MPLRHRKVHARRPLRGPLLKTKPGYTMALECARTLARYLPRNGVPPCYAGKQSCQDGSDSCFYGQRPRRQRRFLHLCSSTDASGQSWRRFGGSSVLPGAPSESMRVPKGQGVPWQVTQQSSPLRGARQEFLWGFPAVLQQPLGAYGSSFGDSWGTQAAKGDVLDKLPNTSSPFAKHAGGPRLGILAVLRPLLSY